jgi:hypothetical protein
MMSLFISGQAAYAIEGTTQNLSIGSSCCVNGACSACTASYVTCPEAKDYKVGMSCTVRGISGTTKNLKWQRIKVESNKIHSS